MRKKCQSDLQESVWVGHTLNLISDTPESAYVAISSAWAKMQNWVENLQGGLSGIPQGAASYIPQGG